MKKPFFSIIIPTFNRAHLIQIPIKSILNQTFEDWELIIIDDGSTDNTQEIVTGFNDSRIRYFWQENQKESAARNHGIVRAQGEWICFQDSDDAYLPDHLAVLYDGIKNNPEYKCIKTGLIIYQDGKEIHRTDIKPSFKYDTFPYEAFTTGCYHRLVFDTIKFDERFFAGEDLHFILQVGLKHAIKILPTWTGITYYNPENSGRMGKNYESRIKNHRACLRDVLIWNQTLIQPFLIRARCLNEMQLFSGHLKYNRYKLLEAILSNIAVIFKYPMAYLRLSFEILTKNKL